MKFVGANFNKLPNGLFGTNYTKLLNLGDNHYNNIPMD